MRAINVLLAIAVSVALALLVLEGGLRLVGFGPPPTMNEFHEELGWVKRPRASIERSTSEFDVTFDVNPYGLRDDDDLAPGAPAEGLRVMMLGDSFVLGYTVDREDLFVDQLEGWWRSEGRRVEVVNAGTEGYSTDQEALWFREYGVDYAPHVVVLFPYLNDVFWSGETRYQRFPKPRFAPDGTLETGTLADPGPAPLAARLALTRFAAWLGRAIFRPAPSGPLFFEHPGADAPIAKEQAPLLVETPEFLRDALARTEGALAALARDCEAAGARLLVCPIPPEAAIHEDERAKWGEEVLHGLPEDAWDPDRPVETFLAMAERQGLETLDPRPALRAAAAEGERLYFEDEWHLTPAGNRVLAAYLHESLDPLLADADEPGLMAGGIPTAEEEGGFPIWLAVFGVLWVALTGLYLAHYRDEPAWRPPLEVGALLAVVFTIVLGGKALLDALPEPWARGLVAAFLLVVLGFVAYKLGRRLATIAELLKAFTLRGHWYLMPLVVVLLTIGSLLVVAASSPLVAPFIYTLF